MSARIRRVVVAVALAILMTTALAGVAWAATLVGTDEPDRLIGSPNNDKILGHGGNDKIGGREGDDYIRGGGGNDYIEGHSGDDHIIPGPGADEHTKGGAGNDIMEADDGRQDNVECASGRNDHAYIDVRPDGDGFGNCEYVNGKKMNWDTFDYETWPEAPPKDQR
jgi:Ca2+-binding RTX toxin-like protein